MNEPTETTASFTMGTRVVEPATDAKGAVTFVGRGTVRVRFDGDDYDTEFYAEAVSGPSGEKWGFPSIIREIQADMSEPFVHDGSGPDVDPATGDEAETFQPDETEVDS